MPRIVYNTSCKPQKMTLQSRFAEQKIEKRILFLKNKPGKLLKTNGEPKKQTGNKAKTKLAKLLKTIEGFKKQTGNKPENKAGHVVENKGSQKTNRKQTQDRLELLPALLELSSLPFGWRPFDSPVDSPRDAPRPDRRAPLR